MQECQRSAIVVNQVLDGLVRQNNLLLVQHETVEEHNAAAQERVRRVSETVLVRVQKVARHDTQEDVDRQDEHERLEEHVVNKFHDSRQDYMQSRHEGAAVVGERHGTQKDNQAIKVHDDLVERVQAVDLVVGFILDGLGKPVHRVRIVYGFDDLTEPDQYDHKEV